MSSSQVEGTERVCHGAAAAHAGSTPEQRPALQRDARCEAIARAQTSEEIPLLEQNFPDAVSSAFSNQRSLMESSATAVGDWLSHHSLPRDVLLPLLEAHARMVDAAKQCLPTAVP